MRPRDAQELTLKIFRFYLGASLRVMVLGLIWSGFTSFNSPHFSCHRVSLTNKSIDQGVGSAAQSRVK